MKIACQWLKEYLHTDMEPEALSLILTSIGLEVEGLEPFESVKGGLEGFVTGHVLTCQPHPNSDHLSKTTVDIGGGVVLPIVCGAPNVAAGQKVVVATIGTTIYMGKESFQIKKAKIRGEESVGMICAEDEMGIGTSHSGILVLDPATEPGLKAADLFGVTTDKVFEIGLTPNRIDAASHYGVARDLYAALKVKGYNAGLRCPDVSAFRSASGAAPVALEVRNPEACPAYYGVSIQGVTVKESPAWLKTRLRSIGLNPINNVVDITNYVLHELGQPLHAFDLDAITSKKVVVQTLPEGSRFTTLDGVERTLSAGDLMICNGDIPMCIGGVFGGIDSGIKEGTTGLFLESACFSPISIRRTARRHGLNTDASFRFERGVDPNLQRFALQRAALLICEIAGGTMVGDVQQFGPDQVPSREVALSLSWLNRFIGKALDRELVISILSLLDITIAAEKEDTLQLLVPPYRVDVTRDVDVAEEILRIYGYDNVEMNQTVHSTLTYTPKPDRDKLVRLVSDFLSANGFAEAMNNSLTSSGYYEGSTAFPSENTIPLLNPLSVELNAMRQTLLFGGLESVSRNIAHRNSHIKLYEFGNVYSRSDAPGLPIEGIAESYRLALFLTGSRTPESWMVKQESLTFFDMKAVIENLLARLGIAPDSLQRVEQKDEIFAQSLIWQKKDKVYVQAGQLSRNVLSAFGIKQAVWYADFDFDRILGALRSHKIAFTELPKYPEVRRDLALLVGKEVRFADLKAAAFASERRLLKEVSLFDVYEGDKIAAGKKSYALSFILQDTEKTLTDGQIDAAMQKLIKAFESQFEATLRK